MRSLALVVVVSSPRVPHLNRRSHRSHRRRRRSSSCRRRRRRCRPRPATKRRSCACRGCSCRRATRRGSTIDPAKPTFEGSITITGEISIATSVIWLHGRHLTVKKATATGRRTCRSICCTSRRAARTLLELARREARCSCRRARGSSRSTTAARSTRSTRPVRSSRSSDGAPYVFTQFEAVYARRVFPCLDEPDSKVPWQLTLDVPKGLVAVSNTPIANESEAGAYHHVEFAQTKPLPSYLVAFGVGPFEHRARGRDEERRAGADRDVQGPRRRGRVCREDHRARASICSRPGSRSRIRIRSSTSSRFRSPPGSARWRTPGSSPYTQRYMLMDAKPSWERRDEWVDRRGARARAPVVRRFRHDRVVGRHLVERGLRELDGEQDHRASSIRRGTTSSTS